MTFSTKGNEKGTDRIYIISMNDCQYEKGESHGNRGFCKGNHLHVEDGLRKEFEEEAKILAKAFYQIITPCLEN